MCSHTQKAQPYLDPIIRGCAVHIKAAITSDEGSESFHAVASHIHTQLIVPGDGTRHRRLKMTQSHNEIHRQWIISLHAVESTSNKILYEEGEGRGK